MRAGRVNPIEGDPRSGLPAEGRSTNPAGHCPLRHRALRRIAAVAPAIVISWEILINYN